MSEHNHEHCHDHHGHHHSIEGVSGKKLFFVVVLNAIITLAEFIGGFLSGSIALVSDAVHNLSDTAAIALSYFANLVARRPVNERKTYGYKRIEIISAFVNSTVLFAISAFLIYEAYERFMNPVKINSDLMLIVAVIGLFANLISMFLLEKDAHGNLNIKASYLHIMGDTLSSVGVIIGGLLIKYFGILYIDPILTILIALYIMKETVHVIKTTINILMQASAPIDYDRIKNDIEKMEGISGIHHIHSWMLNEKTILFEAHLDVEIDVKISELKRYYSEIEDYLKREHGVDHVTLQAELGGCEGICHFER